MSLPNLVAPNTVLFTSNGTWICPPGVYEAVFLGSGAGGGGGGGSNGSTGTTRQGGGGGGAGAIPYQTTITGLVPGNSYSITIGAGGTGGAAHSNGSIGGYTYISTGGTTIGGWRGGSGGAGTSGTAPGAGGESSSSQGYVNNYAPVGTGGVAFGGAGGTNSTVAYGGSQGPVSIGAPLTSSDGGTGGNNGSNNTNDGGSGGGGGGGGSKGAGGSGGNGGAGSASGVGAFGLPGSNGTVNSGAGGGGGGAGGNGGTAGSTGGGGGIGGSGYLEITYTPQSSCTLWVDGYAGDDTYGSGTIMAPFKTINKAMGAITDASVTKPYGIMVGPGTYSDNIALKGYVSINGMAGGFNAMTLTGTFSLGTFASTAPATITNAIVTASQSLTFTAQTGAGWLYLESVFFQDTLIVTSNVPGENSQLFMVNGGFSGDTVTFTDIYATTFNCQFATPVVLNATISIANWDSTSDNFFNAITVNATDGYQALMQGGGSAISGNTGEPLTLNGANAIFSGSSSSIPTTVVLTAGAPPPYLTNGANGVAYVPATPANWVSPAPATVSAALDRMAALLNTKYGAIPTGV